MLFILLTKSDSLVFHVCNSDIVNLIIYFSFIIWYIYIDKRDLNTNTLTLILDKGRDVISNDHFIGVSLRIIIL